MQLNHADGVSHEGQSTTSDDGFTANAASINGSSHLLVEIAGLLYEGRMDGENATLCRVPRSHYEIAGTVWSFADFAKDQYEDMVLLLAALSTKLSAAGNDYTETDLAARKSMEAILKHGRLVASEDR
ncbi:hypothetical protein LRS74_16895 [Streptomyces sp. LX-29]|uniref:hypothetical protein n=1 Tax=Streptomyces sp. LX-29 TaxID=2900152 RepID=UPI00240E4CA1|nr:hypothetical protein [Streptomyces sp. LX-29]WFB08536.1 hypothetical protein LRS74_16895 [Streptomyces sp. LX-29]